MIEVKILKKDFSKYPLLQPLLEIKDTPKNLNFKINNKDILKNFLNKNFNGMDYKVLTIVGSRKYTSYGKDVLEYLLRNIKGEKVIIISGLAIGIDALAHKNALKNNLKTISIPGSGLNEKVLYPAQNRGLAKEILETNNLLVSEYNDLDKGQIYYFPARNRLMAAISDAVLIIEATEKSGTLITARLAMEYGKDVGVIPNNILSLSSVGSNKLIQAGAMPILNVDDIFELLRLEKSDILNNLAEKTLKEIIETLNNTEKKIFQKVLKVGSIEKDILFNELQNEKINYTEGIVALMSLEVNNLIVEEMGEIRIRK